jgi:tetratricopeptide (TPR) repeat protein
MGLTGKWLSATVLLILAGCQSTGPVQTTGGGGLAGTGEVTQEQFVAEPGLSNRQRLRKAIDQLALGSVGQAEAELRAYMENVSNSKIARDLLAQIIAPINELYPEEFVEISLDEGTSLSSIAKQYLGNPLQFYGLARYNNIKEPGKTVVGQVIKVPLTEQVKAKLASLAADVEATPDSGIGDTTGDAVDKLEQAEPLLTDSITTIESPEYTIGGLELVSVLLADNDYEGAVLEFERRDDNESLDNDTLGRLASAYIASGDHLTKTHPKVASDRYFNAGKLMLTLGQKQSALNALADSVGIDNKNGDAQALLSSVKTDLTDAYHREASQAFRRQELDIAIELWEKVITIDPDHAHAGNNLMQAQELKEKLGHLE